MTVQLVEIRGPDDLETAFTAIVREHARAVSAMPDVPITFALHRKRIIEFAANNRLPLTTYTRLWTEEGGLMETRAA